ncbi:hypothetical protein LTR50_003572 [Elasticomyces elasticus]|nr:hypothetical protein LTR50_003572 [Elasticomyces elasticus]
MGCCASSARNANGPYNEYDLARAAATSSAHPSVSTILPDTSSRAAINHPVATRSFFSADSPRRSSTSHAPHPTGRPNQPLRAPSPVPSSPIHLTPQPPWTRSTLDREREAFFDTRVTGNPDVWAALRLVCEMLRNGDVSGAQGVFDAVGVTCPSGRIVGERPVGVRRVEGRRGVYDERGEGYEIPGWVVRDPEDIVEDGGMDSGKEEVDRSTKEEGVEEEEQIARDKKRDEKGKGRAVPVGPMVKIRARLSDRGTDVLVAVGAEQTVGDVVRRIQDKAGTEKKVRLGYLGRILDENKTLGEQGWKEGHVVNALVFG